jgi:hypothetical protein
MVFSGGCAIFLVPALFVLVERVSHRKDGRDAEPAPLVESEPTKRKASG